MKAHRSGLLGLALGAAVLGLAACDDTTEVVIPPPPPPPLTITVTPASLELQVGRTAQFVATVSGGAEGTARTVTWSTSSAAVATVNAQGVVTAVAPGTATITATATADNNVRAAAAVTVVPDPATAPITVSIKSITNFATTIPVNVNNVAGQIDVTINLDVPPGALVSRVETLIDGSVVCNQAFTTASLGTDVSADAEAAAAEIICSIDTAAFNATTGAVTFPNGPHSLQARAIRPGGQVVATPSVPLIFRNTNFIRLAFSGSKPAQTSVPAPRSLAPAGSLWYSGDIVGTGLAVNYDGPSDRVASVTVSMTSSGQGVTGVGGCVVPVVANVTDVTTDPTVAAAEGGAGGAVTPDCVAATAVQTVTVSSPFTVTFPATASMAAGGLMNVEDIFTVSVAAVTVGGQQGPTCINPDPTFNPQGPLCGTFFANPPRVDNLAPRLILMNHFRNPNNYFGPNSYSVSHVAGLTPACPGVPTGTPWFGLRRLCVRTTDYGVGGQLAAGNSSVDAVVALTGAAVAAPNAAALAGLETATSNDWRIRFTVRDRHGNERVNFARTTFTEFGTTAAAGTQLWGWDETKPTQQVAAGAPGDMSVNTGIAAWSVLFTDAAVPPAGPSGFDTNPVWTRLQRYGAAQPTSPTCHIHNTPFTSVSCTTNSGFVADDGTYDNPGSGGGLDGYYRSTFFTVDAAGNVTDEMTRWTLNDFTAPSFTGGIVVPAVLAGGQGASFSSALSENVDLGSLDGYITYGATEIQFAPKSVLGTFGPDQLLGTSAGPLSTNAFVRRVEGTTVAGLPNGTPVLATDIRYNVRDMAGHQIRYFVAGWGAVPYTGANNGLCPAATSADGTSTQNCSTRTQGIAVQTQAGFPGGVIPPGSAFADLITLNGSNAAHGLFTQLAPTVASICNNDARTNCVTSPAQPFTTTLRATLTGPAATFQSVCAGVDFFYLNGEGYWEYVATAGAPTVTDNTPLTTRTFTYSGTFDARNWKVRPAGGAPGTDYQTVALCRRSNGDGLLSTVQTVNVRGN
jgi:hypothetical protein